MSIFDHPDVVAPVPTWRCPHCRTLQPQASSCRSCSRSTVSCSTCQLYRASVAGDLGYCANDKTRSPLAGDEVRSCWTAPEVGPSGTAGLFDELKAPVPVAPAPAEPAGKAVPPPPASPASVADRGLIEAPYVAPGRPLASELQRRSQRERSG